MSEQVVCIIPARIGSKRLPRKNIKDLHGRPLLAWTIIQAKHCKYVDGIYVTTDSEEIARVAEDYGAVPMMRENFWESLDACGGGPPMAIAAQKIAKVRSFDSVLALFCTSPLRKPGDLDRIVEMYYNLKEERGGDMRGIAVGPMAPRYETFITRRIDNRFCYPELIDKTYRYMETCGGASISPADYYTSQVHRVEDDSTWRDPMTNFAKPAEPQPYVTVDWWQCFEVDRPEDFDICEYFFGAYLKNQWEEIYAESRR